MNDFIFVGAYIFGLILIMFASGLLVMLVDFLFFYFTGSSPLIKLERFLFDRKD